MKYQFKASIIVEANTEEEALQQIAGHVARTARHVSEEKNSVANTDTFFTLEEVTKGEPVDLNPHTGGSKVIKAEKE